MKKFRVWCKNFNEWEKDRCYLASDGILFQLNKCGNLIHCKPETHIVQFEIGKNDDNEQKLFDGDIVKIEYENIETKEYIGIIEQDVDGWWYILLQEYGISLDILNEKIIKIEKIGNEFENPELVMQ